MSRNLGKTRRTVDRRTVLRMLGALGGGSLVFGALDSLGMGTASAQEAPPDLTGSGNGQRVIILGAGVAGMAAAFELNKLGYETPILEARDFAGGRCQTARQGFSLSELGGTTQRCQFDEGQYINHGPWRIPYHHRSTLHYTKEFNVPLEIMVNRNKNAWVLYEDTAGPLSGQRVRLGEVQADMRGYTNEILAKAVRQDQLDLELSPDDQELLVDYLVREGYLGSEDLAYTGTGGRGYAVDPGALTNPGPGEPSEPYDFVALLRSGLGNEIRSVTSYSQPPTPFEPVGGMDKIAQGFEGAVGQHIIYNAEVARIRQSDSGVQINYADRLTGEERSVEGDYCLCTIPLSVLIQIPTDVSGEFARAMRQVPYQPVGKMGLQFKRRFWEEDDHIYGGHSYTNFFGDISYPSYGYQGEKGVILGYYNFSGTAVRVSNMSPEGRVEYALENGSKLHPDSYREEFETGFSVAWHRVKYSLGGWASWSDEGLETAYPTLTEPDGRLYLAGEHMSYLTGWMAGGIESAWQQIEKIHQRASQEAHTHAERA